MDVVADEHESFDLSSSLNLDAVLRLMAAFAMIDGDVNDKEVEVIERVFKYFGLDREKLDGLFRDLVGQDCLKICEEQLAHFKSESDRSLILNILFQIANADDLFHLNEKLFLDKVRELWGVQVTFGRAILHWDEHQKTVISAPGSDWQLVTAGPGAGKTAVACARVADLLDQGVTADNVWIVSFTRTAVREISDRISAFASTPDSVLGVKIATIDSRAWNMRYGLGKSDIEKLFGGYEQGIEEATRLVRERREQFEEHFTMLEHVIIDEAQDITPPRIDLIIEILKLLSPECGVTIFGDRAQAIYGFTNELDQETGVAKTTLIDAVLEAFPGRFQRRALTKMHRTESPELITLLEGLRLDVIVDEGASAERLEDVANRIREGASGNVGRFTPKELYELDNTLVLFRTRAEVLQASAYALTDRIPHRLRIGGAPQCVRPWISQIFYDYFERSIDFDVFAARWEARKYFLSTCGQTARSAWETLCKITEEKERVSLPTLRGLLSRTTPDIRACLPELGSSGPILGTIHSSKGREADDVILFLSDRKGKNTDYAEESRVLFVGASRARKTLTVGESYKDIYSKTVNGRRVIRRIFKGSKAQVQLGAEGDVDLFSPVAVSRRSEDDAIEVQRSLALSANGSPVRLSALSAGRRHDYAYDLIGSFGSKDEVRIGSLSDQVNHDLFTTRNIVAPWAHRIPDYIPQLHMIGLRSVVCAEGDARLNEVHPMFRESGFWVAPVILGFPTCSFY